MCVNAKKKSKKVRRVTTRRSVLNCYIRKRFSGKEVGIGPAKDEQGGARQGVCPGHGGDRDTGASRGWGGRQGHHRKSTADPGKDLRF